MNEWSVNYAEQKVIAETLAQKIAQLEAQSMTVMFFGPKLPTQSDWEETYVAETRFPLPILPGARLIWYHTELGAIKSFSTIWDVAQGTATSGKVYPYTDTSQPMGSFRLLGSMAENGSLVDGFKDTFNRTIDDDRILQLTRQYRMLWILITSQSIAAGNVVTQVTNGFDRGDTPTRYPSAGLASVTANVENTTGTSVNVDNTTFDRATLITSLTAPDPLAGFVGMICLESPDYTFVNNVMGNSINSPQVTFYGANFVNGYTATTIRRFLSFGHSQNNNVLKKFCRALMNGSTKTTAHRGYIYGWAATDMGAIEEFKDVIL